MRKVQYISMIEEWPINLWDVVVTEWLIGKLVLYRKICYRTCKGMDSRTVKPYTTWFLTGGRTGKLEESKGWKDIPEGCMWVSSRIERVV